MTDRTCICSEQYLNKTVPVVWKFYLIDE